jgi:cadmium resistance protein CadD (predicted permease)
MALVSVCLFGFLVSFILPQPWLGLLWLVPIYLGIRKLIEGRIEL